MTKNGKPDVVPAKAGNQEGQKHWIPDQARNDEVHKTYVVMDKNRKPETEDREGKTAT
jgi:hypothetical protein